MSYIIHHYQGVVVGRTQMGKKGKKKQDTAQEDADIELPTSAVEEEEDYTEVYGDKEDDDNFGLVSHIFCALDQLLLLKR